MSALGKRTTQIPTPANYSSPFPHIDFIPLSSDANPPSDDQMLKEKKPKFRHPKKSPDELKQIKVGRQKRRARLIIRNISFKSTKTKLMEHFSQFGKVEELDILKKPDGKMVGCAFIQYEKVNEAAKAILMSSGKEVLGRTVYVDWAVGKDQYDKQKRKTNVQVKEESDAVDVKTEDDGDVEIKNEETDSDDEEMDSDEEDRKDIKMESDSDADEEEMSKRPMKKRSNDVSEGCTVFIKNVPFDASDDDLMQCCKRFGPIWYGVITKDRISGHSKGTGFVKFKVSPPTHDFHKFESFLISSIPIQNKESANMCLNAGTEFRLFDQVLDPCLALSRQDILSKTQEAKSRETADSRNLYLSKEGVIVANTPAAEGVSVSDMAKRHHLERVKNQMLKNLNRFMSKERLTIHNIPDNYDSAKLRKVVETHTKLKVR